jgi:protein-L-isoaspartate(D-aspartate) O-methyltransferase
MMFTKKTQDYAEQRRNMIETQLKSRGIRDQRVLDAMGRVPREAFCPDNVASRAYEDCPLPIGFGQTISQPYIVALMSELAEIDETSKVLEVGTGSAYGAAVLGEIAAEVYTIEYNPDLASRAQELLGELGYTNVTATQGDGSAGWDDHAPFDAIICTAAAQGVPAPLKKQLNKGGHLIIPAGYDHHQSLLKITHTQDGLFEEENAGIVAFVPLRGEYA